MYKDAIAPVGVAGYLQKLLRVLQPVLSLWYSDDIYFLKNVSFCFLRKQTCLLLDFSITIFTCMVNLDFEIYPAKLGEMNQREVKIRITFNLCTVYNYY